MSSASGASSTPAQPESTGAASSGAASDGNVGVTTQQSQPATAAPSHTQPQPPVSVTPNASEDSGASTGDKAPADVASQPLAEPPKLPTEAESQSASPHVPGYLPKAVSEQASKAERSREPFEEEKEEALEEDSPQSRVAKLEHKKRELESQLAAAPDEPTKQICKSLLATIAARLAKAQGELVRPRIVIAAQPKPKRKSTAASRRRSAKPGDEEEEATGSSASSAISLGDSPESQQPPTSPRTAQAIEEALNTEDESLPDASSRPKRRAATRANQKIEQVVALQKAKGIVDYTKQLRAASATSVTPVKTPARSSRSATSTPTSASVGRRRTTDDDAYDASPDASPDSVEDLEKALKDLEHEERVKTREREELELNLHSVMLENAAAVRETQLAKVQETNARVTEYVGAQIKLKSRLGELPAEIDAMKSRVTQAKAKADRDAKAKADREAKAKADREAKAASVQRPTAAAPTAAAPTAAAPSPSAFDEAMRQYQQKKNEEIDAILKTRPDLLAKCTDEAATASVRDCLAFQAMSNLDRTGIRNPLQSASLASYWQRVEAADRLPSLAGDELVKYLAELPTTPEQNKAQPIWNVEKLHAAFTALPIGQHGLKILKLIAEDAAKERDGKAPTTTELKNVGVDASRLKLYTGRLMRVQSADEFTSPRGIHSRQKLTQQPGADFVDVSAQAMRQCIKSLLSGPDAIVNPQKAKSAGRLPISRLVHTVAQHAYEFAGFEADPKLIAIDLVKQWNQLHTRTLKTGGGGKSAAAGGGSKTARADLDSDVNAALDELFALSVHAPTPVGLSQRLFAHIFSRVLGVSVQRATKKRKSRGDDDDDDGDDDEEDPADEDWDAESDAPASKKSKKGNNERPAAKKSKSTGDDADDADEFVAMETDEFEETKESDDAEDDCEPPWKDGADGLKPIKSAITSKEFHHCAQNVAPAGGTAVDKNDFKLVHNRSLVPKGVTPPKAVLKVTSVFGPGTSVPSHKATGDRLFGAQKSQKAKTARVLGTVPKGHSVVTVDVIEQPTKEVARKNILDHGYPFAAINDDISVHEWISFDAIDDASVGADSKELPLGTACSQLLKRIGWKLGDKIPTTILTMRDEDIVMAGASKAGNYKPGESWEMLSDVREREHQKTGDSMQA